ncbi:alpha/beta fold hydrolase [Paractinoplanes maris]|uniref:alpha/beta fold hydrolase n=1 Tax=Paractinoplanes maris TaxID=1734446 RepID=UPI002021B322|nr:alpha/beta fold hydrolase [Actinoplanes maris]
MPTVTTSDGVRLHYVDEGDGTPVVLVAGFCAPLESWELQRAALVAYYDLFDAGIPDTGRGLRGSRLGGLTRVAEVLGGPPVFADPRTPERRTLLQNHAEADWRDVVARMEVPSLFIAARDSQLWPCEHASVANSRATVVVLDDCGHAANLDQPERTNEAILGFLT